LISVALVELLLSTKPPNRVLHETGKDCRELNVEGPAVELHGYKPNDVRAVARGIAGWAVRMFGIKPSQYSRAVQPSMHQGVNRDHVGPHRFPKFPLWVPRQQKCR